MKVTAAIDKKCQAEANAVTHRIEDKLKKPNGYLTGVNGMFTLPDGRKGIVKVSGDGTKSTQVAVAFSCRKTKFPHLTVQVHLNSVRGVKAGDAVFQALCICMVKCLQGRTRGSFRMAGPDYP